MPVPDFQSWFLPLLAAVADGQIHKMSQLYDQLADEKGLSADDKAELLPSGRQFTFRTSKRPAYWKHLERDSYGSPREDATCSRNHRRS
jgi:restriction endonuclease Mrr